MADYPVNLNIDYQEKSDRLTVLLRIFWIIPIFIVYALLVGNGHNSNDCDGVCFYGIGFLIVPTLLMILVRQKYPKWWFDWNVNLLKFGLRVSSYFLLLTDQYPSTDDEQGVHLEVSYPDVKKDLNQYYVLIKWLLAIPHVIVLAILDAVVVILTLFVWVLILLTEGYPKDIFNFVTGVMRWNVRVFCYALLMTTDEYPPFELNG